VKRYALAWVVAVAFGCGGGARLCPNATIMNTCANTQREPCHDGHKNTCILCSGSGVANGCIYDPNAPLDGGTAVCVAKCSDCGADCTAG
jgi:hypothetical protein